MKDSSLSEPACSKIFETNLTRFFELSLTTWDHFLSNLNSSAVILASKEAILLPLITTLSGSKYTVFPEDEES